MEPRAQAAAQPLKQGALPRAIEAVHPDATDFLERTGAGLVLCPGVTIMHSKVGLRTPGISTRRHTFGVIRVTLD